MKKIILLFLLLFSGSVNSSYYLYYHAWNTSYYYSTLEAACVSQGAAMTASWGAGGTIKTYTYVSSSPATHCVYDLYVVSAGTTSTYTRDAGWTWVSTDCPAGESWSDDAQACEPETQCEPGLIQVYSLSPAAHQAGMGATENIEGCEYEFTSVPRCIFDLAGTGLICAYEYTSTGNPAASGTDPIAAGTDPLPDDPNTGESTDESHDETPVTSEADSPGTGDTTTTQTSTDTTETTSRDIVSTETNITGSTNKNNETTVTTTTKTTYSDGSTSETVATTKSNTTGSTTNTTVTRSTGGSTTSSNPGSTTTTTTSNTTLTGTDGTTTSTGTSNTTGGTGDGEGDDEGEESEFSVGEGGSFDIDAAIQEVEDLKLELKTVIDTVIAEASAMWSLSSSAAALPCWSFNVLGHNYMVCLAQYEYFFIWAGAALMFVAYLSALRIILG